MRIRSVTRHIFNGVDIRLSQILWKSDASFPNTESSMILVYFVFLVPGAESGFLANHRISRKILVVEISKYQRRYHHTEPVAYGVEETWSTGREAC